MLSFGRESAAVRSAHVVGECLVHAEACNFTEFLFNVMLANYLYM